jgi:biopolymer transport protein ExbB/TolQ
MLHQVLLEAARIGGELVLGLLFIASIVGTAIISDRIWFFVTTRVDADLVDADLFARQLLQALHAGDLTRARSIATRTKASLGLVVAAGISQLPQGISATRMAMRIARGHERMRLEGQLGVLAAIGTCSLLAGLLGTIFDLMQVAVTGSAAGLTANSPLVTTTPDALAVLTPAAAGFLVAIPTLFADRVLRSHVRQTLQRLDSVTQLLLLQLREAHEQHKHSTKKAA